MCKRFIISPLHWFKFKWISACDHTTFWRFRNLLETEGLYETLLEEINQQLTQQGLLIRCGEVSIIDASVIEAKQNRPGKGKDGKNTQDPEAAYNFMGVLIKVWKPVYR